MNRLGCFITVALAALMAGCVKPSPIGPTPGPDASTGGQAPTPSATGGNAPKPGSGGMAGSFGGAFGKGGTAPKATGGAPAADVCEQVRAHLAAPPLSCPQADASFVIQCHFWLASDPKSFDAACHLKAATSAAACACGSGACCP